MKSSEGWREFLDHLQASNATAFVMGMMRGVVSSSLDKDDDVVLITRKEFEAGMREAFIEGQRFARENSLEGTLAMTAGQMADMSQAIKHIPLPETPMPQPVIFHWEKPTRTSEKIFDELRAEFMRKGKAGDLKEFARRYGGRSR